MEDRGERIQGSRYYRDFCSICGDPIRVPHGLIGGGSKCSTCAAGQHPGYNPTGMGTPSSQREYDGGRFNAGEW